MTLILTQEVHPPHSPPVVTFLDHDTACFAYSATDHGYMSLGFGARAMACAVTVDEREALLVRDSKLPVPSPTMIEMLNLKDLGGKDEKPSKLTNVEWPVAPEETSLFKYSSSYSNANSSYYVHRALYYICPCREHSSCAIYRKLLG